MKSFNIGDLKIPIPIIQGGMGIGISLSGLAAAVANMGGIGVISSVGIGFLEKKRNSTSEPAILRHCVLKSEKAGKNPTELLASIS